MVRAAEKQPGYLWVHSGKGLYYKQIKAVEGIHRLFAYQVNCKDSLKLSRFKFPKDTSHAGFSAGLSGPSVLLCLMELRESKKQEQT